MSEYNMNTPVRLGAIDRDHLLHFMLWRNDPELRKRTRQWRLLTMEDQENWYDSIVGQKWPEHVMFVIEAQLMELRKDITVSFFANQLENKENNDPNLSWQGIGVIGLCYVDYIARSAELSIYIGSEANQRKGYGTKAIQQACEKLSDDLIEKILNRWQMDVSSGGVLTLKVQGITDYAQLSKFKASLKYYVRNLTSVTQRDWSGQFATLEVEMKGNADDLAQRLGGKNIEGIQVKVIGMTQNSVTVKLSQ